MVSSFQSETAQQNFYCELKKQFATFLRGTQKIDLTYQGCHFTWKPGSTWKNLEFDNLGKKPGKT